MSSLKLRDLDSKRQSNLSRIFVKYIPSISLEHIFIGVHCDGCDGCTLFYISIHFI